MKKVISIKFGGSVMVPDFPDADYIRRFRELVDKLNGDYRFIIVTGGGGVNKKYNEIAKEIRDMDDKSLDWIGIYTTRLNASLLFNVFREKCHPKIIKDPSSQIDWQSDVLIGAGWKPGWSTDYDSMILANRMKSECTIIATNTKYIYDKDPNKFKDAKPLKHISWDELSEMVGEKWIPRMHIPMDPTAISYAKENKMTVVSLDGRDLENMEKAIKGEEFEGTVIS